MKAAKMIKHTPSFSPGAKEEGKNESPCLCAPETHPGMRNKTKK
jgi:hypothetical protein